MNGDHFRFGSVFRTKTGSNRFWLGFFGLARFFRFGLVFFSGLGSVWFSSVFSVSGL